MGVRPENFRERSIKADTERRMLFALLCALSETDGLVSLDCTRFIERVTSIYLGLGEDWVPLGAGGGQ